MDASQVVTLVKDVATTAAAFVAIYVGLSGLNTWKRQMRGKDEYELARRILELTLLTRNSLTAVRYPYLYEHTEQEFVNPSKSPKEIEFDRIYTIYMKRIGNVASIVSELEAELIKIEALGREDLRYLFKDLRELQAIVSIMIKHYLTMHSPYTTNAEKAAVQEIMLSTSPENTYTLVDSFDSSDAFNKRLEDSIKPIKKYLHPLIHRPQSGGLLSPIKPMEKFLHGKINQIKRVLSLPTRQRQKSLRS